VTSERYIHGHHESVLRSHTWRTVENSASYLVSHLGEGAELLDVGCGPGTITVDFAKRLAPGAVVGLDASESVLEQARELARDDALQNVQFVSGDAYALPFDDDSFDIAHAHQVLQHVADPVAVLREMARVVRPGGIIAARDVDYGGSIWYPELTELGRWHRLYDAVHRNGGGEPDAGRRLASWARGAGLTDVVTTASVWAFTSPDDRAWWGGLWADRARYSSFAEQALESGLAVRDDLDDIAHGWTRWAADPDGWFSFPHGEIIARVRVAD